VARGDHTSPRTTHRPLLAALLAELDDDEAARRELAKVLRPCLAAEPDRLLDAREAAALVKVNPETLVKMAKTGRVPAVKFGREWRFRADQLEASPAAGRPRSPAPPARPRPAAPRERASTLAIRGRS